MTKSQVHAKLVAYETANSDLQPHIRRLLGLFYLAADRSIPRAYVEEILGYSSAVIFRDVSRRWWMVLYYSGLSKRWKRFKSTAEKHGVPEAWRQMSPRLTIEERRLVLQRLGSRPWRLSRAGRKRAGRSVKGNRYRWFKAGTWLTHSPWTRLLIEGKSLASRRDYTKKWHDKIRPHVRLLERECFHMIDPDEITPPEAMDKVVKHIKVRFRELLGRQRINISAAAWFFTVGIPINEEFWAAPKLHPTWSQQLIRRRDAKTKLRRWR